MKKPEKKEYLENDKLSQWGIDGYNEAYDAWQVYHEWYIKENCVKKDKIELDVNKVSDIIQTGVKMLILNELSPYSFDGAIEEIIKSLVPADIIKVKGDGR